MSIAFVVASMAVAVSAGSVSYVKRSDGYGYGSEVSGGYSTGEYNQGKDYYAYPKYKFEYGVKDPHTHDHKSQWETRDGDVVEGEYTLDEADGTVRKVSYHADAKTGFHAKVERIGHAKHENFYGGSEGFGFGTGFGI